MYILAQFHFSEQGNIGFQSNKFNMLTNTIPNRSLFVTQTAKWIIMLNRAILPLKLTRNTDQKMGEFPAN